MYDNDGFYSNNSSSSCDDCFLVNGGMNQYDEEEEIKGENEKYKLVFEWKKDGGIAVFNRVLSYNIWNLFFSFTYLFLSLLLI
jgi:hypothetical protein